MPTFRRFTCVERSIACFLSQKTDIQTELIICNTDIDFPLELDYTFTDEDREKIKIFNCNIDLKTGNPYTSTGAIRRDGVSRAQGNLYITWDDDDIFLPWNIQQCYDGLIRTGSRAWKPQKSILWWKEDPIVDQNVLEATVLMYIEEATFDQNSGPEGLSWFNRLNNLGQLNSDPESIPAYCYYWRDPREIGGHKQGNANDITNPNNFDIHMSKCLDHAQRPLTKKTLGDYHYILKNFELIFRTHEKQDLVSKYVDFKIFTS